MARFKAIEKVIGPLAPPCLVQQNGRMLLPLMTFLPYGMDRKEGTERTWYFHSREYGDLGCPFKTRGNPRYFNTHVKITPEIAAELAVRDSSQHNVRGSDGEVRSIYLHRGRFDPSEDRREWNDYLKRLSALIQLMEKP